MEEKKHEMPQSAKIQTGAGFKNPVLEAVKNATNATSDATNKAHGTLDDGSMDALPVDYRRVAYHGYGVCSCCDERGE